MSDYLPQGVLADILSRLPAKSLLRFRCVCKTWCSLISAPDFIVTHLNRTSPSKTHLLRYFSVNLRTERYSLRSDDDAFTELRELKCPFKTRSGYYFRVIGTCNGLICLSDDCFGYNYTIILWNPAIRKCVTLPKPKVCFEDYGPYMFALGFGVDPRTNDHKVVRVAYLQGTEREGYVVPPKVEVYALSTGKWKSVNVANVRFRLVEYFWSEAFVNGAVHWVAYSGNNNGGFCNLILLFDMGSEIFAEMMLPKKLVGERPLNLSIAVYGNTISVFRYDNRGPGTSKACEVWIMKEYGVAESWSKQFNLRLPGGISRVLGFRNNGELLVERLDKELVSYQPGNKRTKTLGVRGGRDSFHLDTYAESLILLDGANGVQVRPCHGVDSGDERALSEKEETVEGELEQNSVKHYLFAAVSVRF